MRGLILALAGVAFLASGQVWAQETSRSPDILHMPGYEVLAPPTASSGSSELVAALQAVLAGFPKVSAAHLHWVRYDGDSRPAVALLIEGPEDPAVAEAVGRTFAGLFNADQSLDIIFISGDDKVAGRDQLIPIYQRP